MTNLGAYVISSSPVNDRFKRILQVYNLHTLFFRLGFRHPFTIPEVQSNLHFYLLTIDRSTEVTTRGGNQAK